MFIPLPIRQSEAISGAAYNLEGMALDITFANGRTYAYRLVPPQVAAAGDPGAYYSSDIKGQYPR